MAGPRARLFWTTTGIALAVRVAHVLSLPGTPIFQRPIMDAAMHETWARGVLAGTWPGAEPFFRAPLYVYFLAALTWLFERALGLASARLPIALAQALISAAGAGLVALCAERAWGRRAGWMGGLLFAATWTSIYFAGEMLLETLAATLGLLLIWVLLAGDGDGGAPPSGRRLLAAGLVWGLGAITRPPLLIFAPVIVWYLRRRRGLAWRSAGWAALALGLVLPILPVTLHNVVRGRDPVLIASQGGVNFYIGNNPAADGRTAIVPGTRPTWQGGYDDAIALAERAQGRKLKPSEVDGYYVRQGLAFLVRSPGLALKLYARKLQLLFGAGERSNNNNPYYWSKWSPVLRWPIWIGWAPLLLLAVLGYFRRDLAPSRRLLLLGTAAAYALSVLLFFVNSRFRLPLLALLAIPAGGGLDRLWTAWRERRWVDPKVGVAVAAGLLLFSLSDLLTFRENRVDADAFSRFTLGNAYADLGNLQGARAAYEDALAVQRKYRLASFALIEEPLYTSLGRILLAQNQPDAAVRLYTDWVRADPASVAGRVALGDLLLQAGRRDEAAAQFETALRTDPENAGAALGYAWILRANGDVGSALRRFRALLGRGQDVQALFGAGLCLIDLQRYAEAAQAFEDLLRLQPDYWQALGNLAGTYDRLGRTDEARSAYRRLLALHPGDPQAQRWLAEHPG